MNKYDLLIYNCQCNELTKFLVFFKSTMVLNLTASTRLDIAGFSIIGKYSKAYLSFIYAELIVQILVIIIIKQTTRSHISTFVLLLCLNNSERSFDYRFCLMYSSKSKYLQTTIDIQSSSLYI